VPESSSTQQLVQIVIRSLAAGNIVDIDGLGVFYPDHELGVRFEARTFPQVFIAYVKEDEEVAQLLCDRLVAAGFNPWMDVRKMLPGQNWPRSIENAIETSDCFVACFSAHSVRKKGGVLAEFRYALDCARQVPLDEIFIVPVRLDACHLPRAIQQELHHVDLFPDFESGVRRLATTMGHEAQRRNLELLA
jgi:hypothetical protein